MKLIQYFIRLNASKYYTFAITVLSIPVCLISVILAIMDNKETTSLKEEVYNKTIEVSSLYYESNAYCIDTTDVSDFSNIMKFEKNAISTILLWNVLEDRLMTLRKKDGSSEVIVKNIISFLEMNFEINNTILESLRLSRNFLIQDNIKLPLNKLLKLNNIMELDRRNTIFRKIQVMSPPIKDEDLKDIVDMILEYYSSNNYLEYKLVYLDYLINAKSAINTYVNKYNNREN